MTEPPVARGISPDNLSQGQLSLIAPFLDRLHEAHFWIHMMEQYFHQADPFRWHLNVFLKALKEVPQIIQMQLQSLEGFTAWYRPQIAALRRDPLISHLGKSRDVVVHQGVLDTNSGGSVGITNGRVLKLGFGFPISPWDDSDVAMEAWLQTVARGSDFLHFLADDEDTIPCVERYWKLPGFDDDILDLSATAWLKTSELVGETMAWLKIDWPEQTLQCRHSSARIRFKTYQRKKLRERVSKIKAGKVTAK